MPGRFWMLGRRSIAKGPSAYYGDRTDNRRLQAGNRRRLNAFNRTTASRASPRESGARPPHSKEGRKCISITAAWRRLKWPGARPRIIPPAPLQIESPGQAHRRARNRRPTSHFQRRSFFLRGIPGRPYFEASWQQTPQVIRFLLFNKLPSISLSPRFPLSLLAVNSSSHSQTARKRHRCAEDQKPRRGNLLFHFLNQG